jgi:hypothetical protein
MAATESRLPSSREAVTLLAQPEGTAIALDLGAQCGDLLVLGLAERGRLPNASRSMARPSAQRLAFWSPARECGFCASS